MQEQSKNSAGERSLRLSVPATLAGVRTIDAAIVNLLTQAGAEASAAYNVELSVHEIGTNIVRHAYGGAAGEQATIRVTAHLAGGRMNVVLEDSGAPFDESIVKAPNLDDPQEGGYGLFLAQSLLDSLDYERRPNGNVWRLGKRIHS